jgi:nicotinamidase-related amidase
MTTLPNTALMVLDMLVAKRTNAVVAKIAVLVDRVREAGVPVIWVQNSDDRLEQGSEAWEYVPELGRREQEPVVHKSFSDVFEDLTEWGAPPPEQVIAHTNLYWKYHGGPGRTATVAETKDISFSG